MKESILLTGGTGFLGTELASRLARAEETTVYVLVRAVDIPEASHRLRAAWQHDRNLYQAIDQRMIPLPGDFTRPDLGLEEAALQTLRENVTLVIHAGAEIGFDRSRAELERTNVDAGIIAGLYGGGTLRFSERITEGCGQCRAVFRKEECNDE